MARLAAPQSLDVVWWRCGLVRRRENDSRPSAGKRRSSGSAGTPGPDGFSGSDSDGLLGSDIVTLEESPQGRDQGDQDPLRADTHLGLAPHAVMVTPRAPLRLEGQRWDAGGDQDHRSAERRPAGDLLAAIAAGLG